MTKKIFKYVFLIIGVSTVIFSLYLFINYRISTHNYEKDIDTTIRIESEELEQKISNSEEVIVYFGRPSCPDCRVFAPELKSAITNTGKEVYYIQTRTDSEDESLNSIREKYNIEFVPTLLKIQSGNVIIYDDNDDLTDFLKS